MPDRRVHGRNLVDLAGEAGERSSDLIGRKVARIGAGDDDALGVARVAALAETDHAVIRLRLGVEVIDEARGASDADRKQAGGCRIERPGMADTPLTEDASHLANG